VVVIVIVAGFLVGYQYASIWRLPPLTLDDLAPTLPGVFRGAGPAFFFIQNVRTLLLGGLLGIFSFGSLSLVVLMAPFAIIGYATGQLALNGYSPVLVVLALVAPHGIAEIPAAVLAGAAALRLGATVIAPPPGKRLGDIWIQAFTDFAKIVVAVMLPLLVVAALLEVYVTPRVAVAVLGGPLAAAGDLLLAPIRDTLRHRTLWKSVAEARIVVSLLGDTAVAIGAATRVLEGALADPRRFPESRRTRKAG
jgi:uncharacterized membrane protein SpoIIM required for sporulation